VIQKTIEGAGYSPVKILTGHGVGRNLHEDPAIPQILLGKIGKTAKIIPGMTLAIEVIYNQGIAEVFQKDDGWTIVTADGKISATFEKTIAVRDSGVLVLTP
jgi:methionyl aminopeptidase